MKKYLILFPLLIIWHCGNLNFLSKKSNNESEALIALSLLQLSQTGRVQETRPFRWRTVSVVGENKFLHVYDWNFNKIVEPRDPTLLPTQGIESILGSDSGRFSYLIANGNFEIVDSTMNLSPHGDHFHYDRENDFTMVRRTRFQSNGLDTPIGTTPYSVYPKSGWVAFFFKGNTSTPSQIRFVQEKRMGEIQNNIPVWDGPPLPNGIPGISVLLSSWNDLVAMVPTQESNGKPSSFSIYRATTTKTNGEITSIGTWQLVTSIGNLGQIPCPNYNTLSTTQVPSPNASFTDLENGYSKIHYAVLSCGNTLKTIVYNDETQIVELKQDIVTQISLGRIQPLFQNDNIERGSQEAQPIFLANSGQGIQDSIFLYQAKDNVLQPIKTSPYPAHLLGSDTRNGNDIYILNQNGQIETYDLNSKRRKARMSSRIPKNHLNQARFYGTWFGTGLITFENTIYEYNIRENFKARKIQTPGNIQGMALKGFFGPGADYDGPPHN